ncbi:transcription antitermination factor NusB [Sulfuriroseicoccus oceanibius]|uniref:Transcription antitermination protein NusB n=1 Tax=Sulfuriroseicoccus oceanibius TaxID=2707525 RepID=A0A6B3L9B3_9BACT|nr:transcription antitermination factor NusB [Sulfuriroseicoccus oceanibius]QQL43804.1 transcription antitermination factor NusB [Sulfuriroseicoccus oceanibius]
MGKRREGREAALQYLFSNELNTVEDEAQRNQFWELRRAKPTVRAFAEELILGASANLEQIDKLIDEATPGYDLTRITSVDKNILRIATFELLKLPDVPQPVVINEAIEMAKRFSSDDSSRFVNGVLDAIRKHIPSTEADA